MMKLKLNRESLCGACVEKQVGMITGSIRMVMGFAILCSFCVCQTSQPICCKHV